MGRVYTFEGQTVRAATHMPSGQRVECYLPSGPWQECGDGTLRTRDGDYLPVVILRRPVPMVQDGNWYVGPAWLKVATNAG